MVRRGEEKRGRRREGKGSTQRQWTKRAEDL
jgi:hypothetical protein